MRITDYETNRSLNDVGITLTPREAEELCAYLSKLTQRPALRHVHLSEIAEGHLEREITVTLDRGHLALAS